MSSTVSTETAANRAAPNPSGLIERVRKLLREVRASDPGRIRLYASLKGVLACITAGVFIALIFRAAGVSSPNLVLYSVFLCFVTQIAILAPQPALRRRTLLLALAGTICSIAVVALLQPDYWVINLVMAPLIFLSFYFRRYGLIWASVAMVTLFAYYFASIFGVELALVGWAVVAAAIAVASTLLWQNLLWPYNPRSDLMRATHEYTTLAAGVIEAIRQQLAGDPSGEDAARAEGVDAALAELATPGRVLVQQSAALTPPNTPQAALTARLRVTLYETSQGLERMKAAANELAPVRSQLPVSLRNALDEALRVMEDAARQAGAQGAAARLASGGEALAAATRDLSSPVAGELRPALGHMVVGGKQVAQALRALEVVFERQPEEIPPAPAAPAPGATSATIAATQTQVEIWRGYKVHPVTLLGLQALIAFLLGLLVSWVTRLDHPNWVFWTAYVVIAGSTGESLIKMRHRIIGTIAGALVGTLLVFVLPTSVALSLVVIFACIFAALYMRVISYAWMVFFITVMIAGLYGIQGAPSLEVLILRPLNILVGGVIAAVVVLYVLPFHAGDKFKAALVGYLKAASDVIGVLVARDMQREEAASMQRVAAFDALKQTFPSVSYEYNPLTQARSPLLAQDLFLTEFNENMQGLENELLGAVRSEDDEKRPATSRLANTFEGAGRRVQENIAATLQAVAGQKHARFLPLAASADREGGTLGETVNDSLQGEEDRVLFRAIAALARANQALNDLMRVIDRPES